MRGPDVSRRFFNVEIKIRDDVRFYGASGHEVDQVYYRPVR